MQWRVLFNNFQSEIDDYSLWYKWLKNERKFLYILTYEKIKFSETTGTMMNVLFPRSYIYK
jgi:hypothetical protein